VIRPLLPAAWLLLSAAQSVSALPLRAADAAAVEEQESSPRRKESLQLFTEANQLFKQARTREELGRAVENYRALLLERGIRNGHLYYNLGCALLEMRQLGPAILNLRRALRFLPGDSDILGVLKHARSQVPDEFPRKGGTTALQVLFFWHHGTSFETRLWVALIANALFWIFLTARLFVRIAFHRTLLGALLVISLAAGGSAAVEALYRPGQEAVIILPEVTVRSGNGERFDPVFENPIHSGVEVLVVETRGNWKKLRFPDDTEGWVLGSSVEAVEAGLSG